MVLLSYGQKRGIAKGFALPFAQKLSWGLPFLFLTIQKAIYSFGKESLFAIYGYVRLTPERL
jgi:hypothetical protein